MTNFDIEYKCTNPSCPKFDLWEQDYYSFITEECPWCNSTNMVYRDWGSCASLPIGINTKIVEKETKKYKGMHIFRSTGL